MLQYKIPQNVEVEDKIVGPLTMKQLIICAVGGGIAYVLFLALSKTYFIEIWLPPVGLVSIITLAIAFLQIRGIKFTKWIFLMIEAMVNPNKRIWDKDESTMLIYAVPTARLEAEEKKREQKEQAASEEKMQEKALMPQLDELTKALHFPSPTEQKAQDIPSSPIAKNNQTSGDPNTTTNQAPVRPTIARKSST